MIDTDLKFIDEYMSDYADSPRQGRVRQHLWLDYIGEMNLGDEYEMSHFIEHELIPLLKARWPVQMYNVGIEREPSRVDAFIEWGG